MKPNVYKLFRNNIAECMDALLSLKMKYFLTGVLLLVSIRACLCVTEEDEGVKYANHCEVCKIVTRELEARLEETGKSADVIQTSYSISESDNPKYKKQYRKSELRLVESLDGLCNRILEYNIHKERTDSSRFAKGMSQTFRTLHGLVNKGVKVELGIPHELWDKPSVEITHMKTQCESLLEETEEDIEDWFFNHSNIPLQMFLCSERVLKGRDDSCLKEAVHKGDPGEIPQKKEQKDEL